VSECHSSTQSAVRFENAELLKDKDKERQYSLLSEGLWGETGSRGLAGLMERKSMSQDKGGLSFPAKRSLTAF
jgi:hypothetical protein